jgi:ATP/maltotriose-dependent transcriptional regulator MalT
MHSPKACRRSIELLGSRELPAPSLVAECLSNELNAIKRRLVLVLDDYHKIRDRAELLGVVNTLCDLHLTLLAVDV